MRSNVLMMLALAVVFGVAAVFLSNLWLANQAPRAALAQPGEHAENTVVVAAVPLKFGDRLTHDNLKVIPWTAAGTPAGSFRTIDELVADKKGERDVLTPIAVNEPILNWKITGAGQRATLSAVLDKGMNAVSIRVNDIAGVSGFVLPGDRVDVLLTRHTDNRSFVDVLLQNVKVLAVDQITDESKDHPVIAKTVTVEVSVEDAQKLTLAAGVGELSLALRQIGASETKSTGRVTLADLGGSIAVEPEPSATPAEPDVNKPGAVMAPAKPTTAQIGVLRGVELQTYDVPLAH